MALAYRELAFEAQEYLKHRNVLLDDLRLSKDRLAEQQERGDQLTALVQEKELHLQQERRQVDELTAALQALLSSLASEAIVGGVVPGAPQQAAPHSQPPPPQELTPPPQRPPTAATHSCQTSAAAGTSAPVGPPSDVGPEQEGACTLGKGQEQQSGAGPSVSPGPHSHAPRGSALVATGKGSLNPRQGVQARAHKTHPQTAHHARLGTECRPTAAPRTFPQPHALELEGGQAKAKRQRHGGPTSLTPANGGTPSVSLSGDRCRSVAAPAPSCRPATRDPPAPAPAPPSPAASLPAERDKVSEPPAMLVGGRADQRWGPEVAATAEGEQEAEPTPQGIHLAAAAAAAVSLSGSAAVAATTFDDSAAGPISAAAALPPRPLGDRAGAGGDVGGAAGRQGAWVVGVGVAGAPSPQSSCGAMLGPPVEGASEPSTSSPLPPTDRPDRLQQQLQRRQPLLPPRLADEREEQGHEQGGEPPPSAQAQPPQQPGNLKEVLAEVGGGKNPNP